MHSEAAPCHRRTAALQALIASGPVETAQQPLAVSSKNPSEVMDMTLWLPQDEAALAQVEG